MHTLQTKRLDENLPADLEEFLDKSHGAETKEISAKEASKLASDSFTKEHELAQKQETVMMVFTALNLCFSVRITLFFLLLMTVLVDIQIFPKTRSTRMQQSW